MDINKRVHETLYEEFVDRGHLMTDDTLLVEDLGLDSLDMIEMAMTMEEEFQIDIADHEAIMLEKVGDLVKLIQSKIPAAAPAVATA